MSKKKFSSFKSGRQIAHPHLTDIKQKWWQLSSIQSAGTASLPVMLVGSFLCTTYGFYNALLSIFLGNLILMAVGLIVTHLSFGKRQSILELARDYIGYFEGMIIAAALVILVIFGWIPLQLNLVESELLQLPIIQKYICEENCAIKMPIIIGVIVSFIVCFGIKGIKWFAIVSMPLILVFLFTSLFYADFSINPSNQPFSAVGISLVLGSGLSGFTDLPTFFRHSKNINHCIGGVIITSMFFLFVELFGAFSMGCNGEYSSSLIQKLQENIHPFFIGAIIVISAMNANALNIYLGSVGWEIWVPKVVGKQEYFIIGLGGVVSYSLINSIEFFQFVIEFCDIIICSFAGILTASYIFKEFRKKSHIEKRILLRSIFWIIGTTLGFIAEIVCEIPPMIISFTGSLTGLSLFFYFRKIIRAFNLH